MPHRHLSLLLTTILCLGSGAATRVQAQDAAPPARTATRAEIEDTGRALREAFNAARQRSAAEARGVVKRHRAAVSRIHPANPDAQAALDDLREHAVFLGRYLDAEAAELHDLEARLAEAPDDLENFLLYEIKFQQQDDALHEVQPLAEASQRLDRVAAALTAAAQTTTHPQIKEEAGLLLQRIEHFHRPRAQEAQHRRRLVGTPAPLNLLTDARWLGRRAPEHGAGGRVVLLDFWALWCGPCIAALPELDRLRAQHAGDGLVVITAVREEPGDPGQAQRVAELLDAKAPGLPCLMDAGPLFDRCRVAALPHQVLIDRRGVVRLVVTGNAARDAVEQEIRVLLAEPTPTASEDPRTSG